MHKGKARILADAANDKRFSHDPYVVAHKPRSVLCMPLIFRRRVVSILYLENNVNKVRVLCQCCRLYHHTGCIHARAVGRAEAVGRARGGVHRERAPVRAAGPDKQSIGRKGAHLCVCCFIASYSLVFPVQVEQRTKQLMEANQAKSVFIRTMSHEVGSLFVCIVKHVAFAQIRTPLNGVIGSSTLLWDSPLTPEQQVQAFFFHV